MKSAALNPGRKFRSQTLVAPGISFRESPWEGLRAVFAVDLLRESMRPVPGALSSPPGKPRLPLMGMWAGPIPSLHP